MNGNFQNFNFNNSSNQISFVIYKGIFMKKIQLFYLHQREITFVINILLHVKTKGMQLLCTKLIGRFSSYMKPDYTKKIQSFYLHRGVHFCDKYSVAGISQNKKG